MKEKLYANFLNYSKKILKREARYLLKKEMTKEIAERRGSRVTRKEEEEEE